MAINRFTHLIAGGEEVPVYGDGSSRRDYTYVSDIIGGVVAALDAPLPGYQVLNLGRGEPVSLLGLLAGLERAIGRQARRLHLPEQPGDPQSTCADVRRARELLGYEPRVHLAEGLRRYIAWRREGDRDRIGSR
jgi:UDP-glucuronate 4-epimerase